MLVLLNPGLLVRVYLVYYVQGSKCVSVGPPLLRGNKGAGCSVSRSWCALVLEPGRPEAIAIAPIRCATASASIMLKSARNLLSRVAVWALALSVKFAFVAFCKPLFGLSRARTDLSES